MAPAALELLLLGLMHFALARLDIWHWKVLQMLLQNSGVLTAAAAFLPSTTPDGCSWDGQPLQLGELAASFQVTWDLLSTCLPVARLLFYLLGLSRFQVVAPWLAARALAWVLSRGGCKGSCPCLDAGGSQRQDPWLLKLYWGATGHTDIMLNIQNYICK